MIFNKNSSLELKLMVLIFQGTHSKTQADPGPARQHPEEVNTSFAPQRRVAMAFEAKCRALLPQHQRIVEEFPRAFRLHVQPIQRARCIHQVKWLHRQRRNLTAIESDHQRRCREERFSVVGAGDGR